MRFRIKCGMTVERAREDSGTNATAQGVEIVDSLVWRDKFIYLQAVNVVHLARHSIHH